MRYRNVKTGQVVITVGTVTGEDWVSDDPLNQQYEPEETQEPEDREPEDREPEDREPEDREHEEDKKPVDAPKAPKSRSRSKKAAEE